MKKHLLVITAIFVIIFSGCTHSQEEFPVMIEIIDNDNTLSEKELSNFIRDNQLKSPSLYRWQNHWLIFTSSTPNILEHRIFNAFPTTTHKLYEQPFYIFDRKQQCSANYASQWKYFIISANLVQDTAKQNEYMQHHATQWEKWPEISDGFCNAEFQQLLIYKNGRQLMLTISIPEGKSIEELNPKTTENNPRVDDWNAMMSQYQEGLEDAPEGVTWIEFVKVNLD